MKVQWLTYDKILMRKCSLLKNNLSRTTRIEPPDKTGEVTGYAAVNTEREEIGSKK